MTSVNCFGTAGIYRAMRPLVVRQMHVKPAGRGLVSIVANKMAEKFVAGEKFCKIFMIM